MTTEKRRRVSVTKLQRETAVGAELIALCQTITEDGSLADEEVAALRQWVTDNAGIDLPARDFLHETIEKILADGKVTPDERLALQDAIEKALPPDVRADVQGRRRTVEAAARERARAERDGERERNAPSGTWDFMVAGTQFEGRAEVITQHADPGDRVFLARDPANRFSRNAVEVRLRNGLEIGFVPEEDAVEVAPLLDEGHLQVASIKKILTGGRRPIPVVVASLYPPHATKDGLVRPTQVPAHTASPRSPGAPAPAATRRSGCAVVLLVVALVVAGAVALAGLVS